MWILKTGARREDMPERYPLIEWVIEGVFDSRLAGARGDRFIDCSSRGLCVGKTKKGKGTKLNQRVLVFRSPYTSAAPQEGPIVELKNAS